MNWDSIPRRVVTLYIPLAIFVLVLLFPFYWMAVTTFKPNNELYDYKQFNPFWVHSPTLQNVRKLLFDTDYPTWLMTTMGIAAAATCISIFASVLAAYAIQRLRFKRSNWVGLAIYLAYLVPPSILFIPLATMVFKLGLFDTPWALILTYPTFLIPFCTWLLIGYFKSIPYELEECAADRWRDPAADPAPDHAAACGAGADQRRHLRVHAVLERVHLCARIHPVFGKEDGSGSGADPAGPRRRLPMGVVDGRGVVRVDPRRAAVLVLRRVLRQFPDRGGEGVVLFRCPWMPTSTAPD